MWGIWRRDEVLAKDSRSYQEMSESYRELCEREIRNLICNAVPTKFSWEDLMKFVPEGEQII
ncbi:MAG: hypothetical protein J2P21_31545 [Chloracidobacterium sp.]|nr:hypothetical protein [Chloracidobacterium sp.]